MANPFKASLGASPPLLVGRDDTIADFKDALFGGPGTHERISLVTGARGIGKTVLLNALEEVAREQGWRVFAETATAGFISRLRDSVSNELADAAGKTSGPRISSLQLGGVGIGLDREPDPPSNPSLRELVSQLLDVQAEIDNRVDQEPTGVLITLDELHHLRTEEIVSFAVTVQHLVREDREISVVMAGIPSAVTPLLSDDSGSNPITFLRRANRIELGTVEEQEVSRALEDPVTESGHSWDSDALSTAVSACGGYPFMIQLVGQYSFRNIEGSRITLAGAEDGAARARRKLGQLVHEPSLSDLSDVDRTFLAAMAVDDGPSRISRVSERMKATSQYTNIYRRRLLDASIISSPRRGVVDFTLPYLRDYLREHVITDALVDLTLTEEEQLRLL